MADTRPDWGDSLDESDPNSHERRKLKRDIRQERVEQFARRQRRNTRIAQAFVTLLVAAAVVFGYLVFSQGGGARGPSPAPVWQATSIDGQRLSSQSLKGDVYVVDFFFTWCPICRAQLPHKQALVNHFREHSDFHFLSVSADPSDSREALDAYRRTHGATWPFAQDRDSLYQKFGVNSRPFIVFVDRDGLIAKVVRSLTEGDKLIRIVEPLLARPPSTEANATSTAPTSPSPSGGADSADSYDVWAVASRRR